MHLDWKRKLGLLILLIICIAVVWGVGQRQKGKTAMNPAGTNKDKYIILAYNDLGMHCMQANYDAFMILPPGNNLKVQVFKQGKRRAELVASGITVEYTVINNTTSADKINFWQYAADYGFKLKPNEGITGNYLSGKCRLSADGKYYEVTAIPLTPYLDGSRQRKPYQEAKVTVKDAKSGRVLAAAQLVLPVSDEMNCDICHGKQGTDKNILIAHDVNEKTHLYADLANNVRHACSECHPDNALGAPGKRGVLPLSQAMHGFHANKMTMSKLKVPCYTCHPGIKTKCNRGVMAKAGITCANVKCHGSMKKVADSQKQGRKAWLQEPDCRNCHGQGFGSQPAVLYRNSYLFNAPAKDMNNKILCPSCHNSPHAEWPSLVPVDNQLPWQLQGRGTFIYKCTVCHQGKGKVHRLK